MSRGSDNILYNPPKIHKKPSSPYAKMILHPGEKFASKSIDFLLTEDGQIALQEDDGGVLMSFERKKSYPVQSNLDEVAREIQSNGTSVLTDEGFLWFEGSGLYLQNLAGHTEVYRHFFPGDMISLFADKKTIYFLHNNRTENKITLSAIDRASDQWRDIKTYQKDERVVLENLGKEAIIWRRNPQTEDIEVALIHDGEVSQARKVSDLFESNLSEAGSFLRPGLQEDEYFAVTDDGIFYLDLSLSKKQKIADNPGSVIDVAASEGHLAVLKKGYLALYHKGGLIEEISLSRPFSRLSFSGQKIILWDPGYQHFQEVKLSREF